MIKWTGSKKWLTPAFKQTDSCLELFAGAAHVSFRTADKVYLNDTCRPLTEMYLKLKQDKHGFIERVRLIFDEIQHAPDPRQEYIKVRSRFNAGCPDQAEHFVAILYSGFNGLWRESINGCNVPYGGPRRLPIEHLQEINVDKILGVTCGDWLSALENAPVVSRIYVDPPYAGSFTGYNSRGWTDRDNDKLFSALASADASVIISCKDTPECRESLAKSKFDFISVSKLYTNGARGSVRAKELVAFNSRGLVDINFKEIIK